MSDTKQVRVDEGNWRWLNSLKEPGDSFNDVVDHVREVYGKHEFQTEHRLSNAQPRTQNNE